MKIKKICNGSWRQIEFLREPIVRSHMPRIKYCVSESAMYVFRVYSTKKKQRLSINTRTR